MTKSYGATTVLSGVDLEIGPRGCTAVLGPSGSGKSTLLRIVAGLVEPTAGTVAIRGRTVNDPGIRVRPEQRGVAFLFQDLALWPHMTVRGNLDFVIEARRVAKADRRAEGERAAGAASFPAVLLDRRPSDISGGERQRAALARVLAQAPQLLLLDEPLSHLDPALRATLLLELRRILGANGLPALLVTHDMAEAFALADTVVVMHRGRIEQSGSPRDVYERPATRFVAEFVGAARVIPAVRRGGALVTAVGEFPADGAPDGEVAAVVRPERVRAVTGGPIRARVADAVFQGDHWIWYAEAGPDAECVLVRSDRPAARGEDVTLVADRPWFVPAEKAPEVTR